VFYIKNSVTGQYLSLDKDLKPYWSDDNRSVEFTIKNDAEIMLGSFNESATRSMIRVAVVTPIAPNAIAPGPHLVKNTLVYFPKNT
jgi:hypothetical protein